MTEKQINLLKKQAKGSWQKEIIEYFIRYQEIENPLKSLKGKAKEYYFHYQKSWYNLHVRIVSAGFTITQTPGPRGGEWGSVYKIES